VHLLRPGRTCGLGLPRGSLHLRGLPHGLPGGGDRTHLPVFGCQEPSGLGGTPPAASRGDCGAAASAGTVLSILRGATPLADGARTEALRATAQTLLRIAEHGGPRCCKQSVFDTLLSTWERLQDELGLEPLPPHACAFAGQLKDRKAGRCPYFG